MDNSKFITAARWFLYTSVFAITVVLAGTFFPFIGGKYYFFRFFVEASLAALLLWWGLEAKPGELSARFKEISGRPLFIAVSVFVLSGLLASIFAYDSSSAFWSNFERGEGAFQLLHYYAFFVLCGLLLRTRSHWKAMLIASVSAATVMVLYGMGAAVAVKRPDGSFYNPLNLVGPYGMPGTPGVPDSWFGRVFSNNRFQGSLGNPAYIAPHLMFTMFFCVVLLFFKKIKRKAADWVKLGLSLAFFLIFFTLSNTRGAFLGLVAGIFVLLAYIVWQKKEWRNRALIVLGSLILIYAAIFPFRNRPAVQAIPGARFLTISPTEQSAQTRLWTWGSALKGVKDRPVFGWGQENFSHVFDRHLDTRHFTPGTNSETWFDRAHSVVFDYLAETGIFGLLAYLSMLGTAFWGIIKFSKNKITDSADSLSGNKILQAAGLGVITAYFVQGLFLFDVLPIYIPLFTTLAYFLREFVDAEKAIAHESHHKHHDNA